METTIITENDIPNEDTSNVQLDPSVKTDLLTNVDADDWIGRYVVIKYGKYTGTVGEIIRCGNGWVQVSDTRSSGGEISKRAHELEIIVKKEDVPQNIIEDSLARIKKAEEKAANSLRATSNRSPSKRTSVKKRAIKPDSPIKAKLTQQQLPLPDPIVPVPVVVVVDEETAIKLRHEACLSTEADHRDRMKHFLTLSQKRHYAECRPNITEFFEESAEEEEEEEERKMIVGAKDYNVLQRCSGCGMEMGSDWKFCWNPICVESPIAGAYDNITAREAGDLVQSLIAHDTLSHEPQLGQLNSNSKRRSSQRDVKPSAVATDGASSSSASSSVLGKRGRSDVSEFDGYLIESHLEYRWRREMIEIHDEESEK